MYWNLCMCEFDSISSELWIRLTLEIRQINFVSANCNEKKNATHGVQNGMTSQSRCCHPPLSGWKGELRYERLHKWTVAHTQILNWPFDRRPWPSCPAQPAEQTRLRLSENGSPPWEADQEGDQGHARIQCHCCLLWLRLLRASDKGQAVLTQAGMGWWAAMWSSLPLLLGADASWGCAVFVQVAGRAARENRFASANLSTSDSTNLCLSMSIN